MWKKIAYHDRWVFAIRVHIRRDQRLSDEELTSSATLLPALACSPPSKDDASSRLWMSSAATTWHNFNLASKTTEFTNQCIYLHDGCALDQEYRNNTSREIKERSSDHCTASMRHFSQSWWTGQQRFPLWSPGQYYVTCKEEEIATLIRHTWSRREAGLLGGGGSASF